MKYFNFYFISLLMIVSACGKSFLQVDPVSVADIADAFKTEADFEQAVFGVYDELQGEGQYGGSFQVLMENRADHVLETSAAFRDGIYFEVDRFLVRSSNPILEQAWGSLFEGIFRANQVMEKLEEAELGLDFERQVEGEVRFTRALAYFNLVRLWGRVPILTRVISPDDALELKREEESLVFEQIEEDLLFALDNLPEQYEGENIGRASSHAARILLAKVLIHQKKYPEALPYLEAVIQSGKYSLLEDIQQVFGINNQVNEEIIFAIRWKKTDDETNQHYGRAGNAIAINENLLESYEPEDKRKSLVEMKNIGSYVVPAKFADPAGTDGKSGHDFPLIRYADVLLLYAETLNELAYQAEGPALDALNEVRKRAGLQGYLPNELPDQASFREAVWEERTLELPLECHRWFDLKRTGKAIQTFEAIGQRVEPYQLFYPLPQSEIERINNPNFQQNEGYN